MKVIETFRWPLALALLSLISPVPSGFVAIVASIVWAPPTCWIWNGAVNSKDPKRSYGQIHNHRGSGPLIVQAHRFAYELLVGPIPAGVYVCHHCDNPLCVNPQHLFLGTTRDNARDMVLKERARPAKLNARIVREARELYRAGSTTQALAVRYGVHRRTITRAIKGTHWGYV